MRNNFPKYQQTLWHWFSPLGDCAAQVDIKRIGGRQIDYEGIREDFLIAINVTLVNRFDQVTDVFGEMQREVFHSITNRE